MGPQTKPQTTTALSVPTTVTLDELRAMAVYKGNLYVVNGGKSASNLLVFQGPPAKGPAFNYLDTVIGPGQSIMHPFGIAFDSSSCYISNQDSNVVAQVNLTAGNNGQVTGSLGSGCQCDYLTNLYPPAIRFLDGTFVASQNGNLVGVAVVAPDVEQSQGGLNVLPASKSGKPVAPSNSVRDVAIANGILFVCDEVDCQVNMYDLSGGAYLGSGSLNKLSPTHLAISGSGLWVSAGESLLWSALPSSTSGASLSFQAVAITLPKKNKVGGISFDSSGNVYVVFQDGTGGTGTGSIQKYIVTSGTPPTLQNATTFATISEDTPEFCLWISDSHWPS
ncbi:MAG TPA: hypothetical protein VKB79_09100 [Bryobacteraceae bacterium]|nr:hypothetical protein [Bryobacteraceae bacterium]